MEISVPYAGTPKGVIHQMLTYAQPKREELLVDLGSGDGRILIEAAENYPINCIGVENDPEMVKKSRKSIEKLGLSDRIEIEQGKILDFDLKGADIVTLYLLGKDMGILEPKIYSELKSTSRIVSHDYEFPHRKYSSCRTIFTKSAFAPKYLPFPVFHQVYFYKMNDIREKKTVKEQLDGLWNNLRKNI